MCFALHICIFNEKVNVYIDVTDKDNIQFLTTLIFFKGNSLSASNTQSHMSIEIINYMEDTD